MPEQLFGLSWNRLPQLVVFDVDFTLWPYWCDTHTSPPYKKRADGKVVDGGGKVLKYFPGIAAVLTELRAHPSIQVALASWTGEPAWLKQMAELMEVVPGKPLWTLADHHEIYPGDRPVHGPVEQGDVPLLGGGGAHAVHFLPHFVAWSMRQSARDSPGDGPRRQVGWLSAFASFCGSDPFLSWKLAILDRFANDTKSPLRGTGRTSAAWASLFSGGLGGMVRGGRGQRGRG